MSIHFLIALNRQGKLRISKWYTSVPDKQKKQTILKVHRLISSRDHQKQSNFVNFENQKLVYRRYNGLFFVMAVDVQDNELSYLEMVHLTVEVLDSYFNNVCELDIIFNFYKVYQVLDEMFLSGEFQETSKQVVLDRLHYLDNLE
ncbi:hypothetical protein KL933_004249 [Ogataea haglerorum]|uniref:AP complex subunit sigma n=1 Tax=Ogataea haglerorum TaxID=1937702 RepID=A0AAN6D2S2_9ASCO|nr:uncharacterized protein KL911_004863 [Ogataea haglerorum]KAG7891294.1 hypothetical protein KL908_004047 [Ogataea polymorpha]KAG7692507.1 hypothetical protein KL915_004554 [Ogataea haglerorum]KAG7692742.1 hypothetical protein KL951_004753 [Ogataea haglerorum]KAG7715601.1 hypothetical protein KL913_003936 [Ogataea haglerorum]KAG7716123.1 hypothetical protein KL949_004018 [Ogataea haglerorum]